MHRLLCWLLHRYNNRFTSFSSYFFKIGYKVATDKCITTNIIHEEQEIDDYYNLLDTVVTDIFHANNITYWLVSGSLIGSIRSRPSGYTPACYFFTKFQLINRTLGT